MIALEGSYGGARETLWPATGRLPPLAGERSSWPVSRCARNASRWSEIADVLPKTRS